MRTGGVSIVLHHAINHLKAPGHSLLRPPFEWLWIELTESSHLRNMPRGLGRILRLEQPFLPAEQQLLTKYMFVSINGLITLIGSLI